MPFSLCNFFFEIYRIYGCFGLTPPFLFAFVFLSPTPRASPLLSERISTLAVHPTIQQFIRIAWLKQIRLPFLYSSPSICCGSHPQCQGSLNSHHLGKIDIAVRGGSRAIASYRLRAATAADLQALVVLSAQQLLRFPPSTSGILYSQGLVRLSTVRILYATTSPHQTGNG